MILEHIIIIVFLIIVLGLPTTTAAMAQSVVWDEASKSWISTPAAPATTATAPAPVQQQQQPVQQQQYNPPVFQQPIPTQQQVTTSNATVDLGTLAGIITPIIAGIAGIFIKNRKDMEKKDEEVKESTVKMIEDAIIPKLKQIVPVAEQTAKQDVKINEIANLIYNIMGEKANEITNMPEIQQQKLLEDAIRSKIIAEQINKENKPKTTTSTKSEPSLVWDEVKKEWVSK